MAVKDGGSFSKVHLVYTLGHSVFAVHRIRVLTENCQWARDIVVFSTIFIFNV